MKNIDKYSLFLGRFQPFHEGHKKLIDVVLKEGKVAVIGLRSTPIESNNPYTVSERIKQIKKVYPQADVFPTNKTTNVKILIMPDITEVCHGRKVGWKVRELKLDKETEKISATNIRKGMKNGK